MQGSTRPPDSTPRAPRRSGLLFQMSRNGLLVRADNSDLSYKAIMIRLVPGAPTYGAALEALSRAPLAEARRTLLSAALLRALQEVAVASSPALWPEEGGREAPSSARRGPILLRHRYALLRRALDGAVLAASFAGPLLAGEGAADASGSPKGAR